jgi:hypothetical protein
VALGWLCPVTSTRAIAASGRLMMSSTAWVTSSPVAMPCCAWSAAWCHPIGSLSLVVMSREWSTGPAQHCSRMFACHASINGVACTHVLHAMMAQVSGISETCWHTLETREPNRIGRPAKPFFILKSHGF